MRPPCCGRGWRFWSGILAWGIPQRGGILKDEPSEIKVST
ncbi:hypothetical protein NEISICOT_00994 [Neisseria sicca ATCC 29256]|uniref:Uncharacterized protein n=1 Tax=Neisseria sicca ATCC 29256 TaxID=547045 RepID=C6M3A4_NEISI|nr:hypothetical protein NEISICOT_00994 [Neisseria sicca ATCC 29256]